MKKTTRKTKVCFKCDKHKKLSEFYAHPRMTDGYLGKCKVCTRADVCKHRLENLDKIRAYDRARAKLPHRRESARIATARWHAADPRRKKAQKAVHRAIKAGRLKRGSCALCATTKNIHAHHPDYDKQLLVTWLCVVCHKAVHQDA